MFTTPGGMSVFSAMTRPTSAAHHGVSGAGFSTTVLPAASAGPSLAKLIWCGKFHGVMAPTTPNGSRTTVRLVLMPSGEATPRSVVHVIIFGSVGGEREIVDRSLQLSALGQDDRGADLGDGDLAQ